ncbi:MAG TPA: VOC family protein [Candidatus Acidoferrales bacterium]|nr:VOC family protein [Candidatus Acidoferrales bacterium]
MLDHIGIAVADYERSKAFFQQALAPLGYRLLMEIEGWAGFGADDKPALWIIQANPAAPIHIAFRCPTRRAVDAFYHAALAAGGRDNGKPGLRPQYHENYYGAFVHDPDGNNIEAVCHEPE